jgi:5-methylcytosine-specific restriction protein A
LAYLARHPLCCDCLDAKRTMAANEVHHVLKLRERPELQYEETNLKALCGPCHKVRTARGE